MYLIPLTLLKGRVKKTLLFSVICLLITQIVEAQTPEYKVVFDMTSKDTVNQQSLIRQMGSIRESNANAKMEVVIYGQGLDLVIKNGSTQEYAISRLLSDKNISFKICAITMKRHNVDQNRLLPGVTIVPDGIYEIISKQQQGWGYIKVAH
jgi:intracellular sulfur oxidation DsrE/DsrF family protein